jgi:hypothetical protein
LSLDLVLYLNVPRSRALPWLPAHPNADLNLLRAAVGREKMHTVLIAAARSDAYLDPKFRASLHRYEGETVLRWIAIREAGETFRQVRLTVIATRSGHALRILDKSSADQLAALEQEDLVPLLEGEGRRRRIWAMAAAAQVGAVRRSDREAVTALPVLTVTR